METNKTTKLEGYGEALRTIARNNRHGFLTRSSTQIEIVRMMGDQIDSRFNIKEEDGELICHYTFWLDGETKDRDTIYHDVTDYNFLEEIERVMKKSNKEFDKALIDKGENLKDW